MSGINQKVENGRNDEGGPDFTADNTIALSGPDAAENVAIVQVGGNMTIDDSMQEMNDMLNNPKEGTNNNRGEMEPIPEFGDEGQVYAG